MTEAEWLSATDRVQALMYLGVRLSERKRRLFACACCRRFWDWVEGTPAARAVEVAEAFADGHATAKKLDAAKARADAEAHRTYAEFRRAQGAEPYIAHMHASACALAAAMRPTDFISRSANLAAQTYAYETTGVVDTTGGDWGDHFRAEAAVQTALLRDIVGNPFRRVSFPPAWRTDTALTLARQMYESREFGAAPILADALQDAGCDCDDLLNHLRDTSVMHVRGCWALDLVLGKE